MRFPQKHIFFRVLIGLTVFLTTTMTGKDMVECRETASAQDDTMLLFVGEELDILSIASRREESAWQAPAVARVISRKELQDRGSERLSDALGMIPGFYMAQKEWGTQPYLRGIPDSVLFLYDTIPICSDISKSLHSLDYNLSLAPIKRIEIIRGPGSVLWGPDAFAGIVNLVPMSGKDIDGTETGISYGMPGDQKSFYLNTGYDTGLWDIFLSVSGREGEEDDTLGNLKSFWGSAEESDATSKKPTPLEERFGETTPGISRYLEASARFSYRDWLTISGRLSDNQKPFAISYGKGDLTWQESRSTPLNHIKLETKKNLDRYSAIRFAGAYTGLRSEYEVIDKILLQKEETFYGEGIYDRSFFTGEGLLTGGISYREKKIRDAPIWDGYLPDYLGPKNLYFLPELTQKDYNTRLRSVFAQYGHKLDKLDVWMGIRFDDHDEYQDRTSFNTGMVWSPSAQWRLKILYGTAYRTPFARQLIADEKPDLENIESVNFQLSWMPIKSVRIEVSPFYSRIENHIMEDHYAGLSLPNHQNITGAEFDFSFSPHKALDLSANLTLNHNDGPDERYKYSDYGDNDDDHYAELSYPFDSGPHTLFNFMAVWRPELVQVSGLNQRVSAFLRLGYFSPTRLIYPRSEKATASATTAVSLPGVWIADMCFTFRDIFSSGMDLSFSLKNLADRNYEIPGTYNTIQGKPFSAEMLLRKTW